MPIHKLLRIIRNSLVFLSSLALSFYFGTLIPPEKKAPIIKFNIVMAYDRLDLNWDNIDFWLDYYHISHKDIVKKQIRLECGHNLDSRIAIENRNILGIKCAKQREFTYTFEGRGHAGYSHWSDCIEDYSIWQHKYYKDGDYYDFLVRSGYAADSSYVDKLKKMP